MNLSTKLRLQKTKILKTGQFYNIILEHKNYRINEPDQFLENSKIDFFAFLDDEESINSNSSLPFLDIGVGRFPVKNLDEARIAVDKIFQYYENESMDPWRLNICFVGDDIVDIELMKKISTMVNIPVIASGGAGNPQHLKDVFVESRADAAIVASITHYGEFSINSIKNYLGQQGVTVRSTWK